MFSPDDTIVAIATPPGRGGIGVVRISGATAAAIAARILTHQGSLEPRRATYTRVRAVDDRVALDDVVATYFPGPRSYTGQHSVEISAHGSPVVLAAIVRGAMDAGARLARPGEFTLRAFLNGKRDLVQAEAVADLIEAVTPLQARIAFDQLEGTLTRRIGAIDAELFDLIAKLEASIDFPDEGYHFIESSTVAEDVTRVITRMRALMAEGARGRLIREGVTVAIVGRPNVGKSSLFNALAGAERAIVTDVPGTTRDLITERVDIGGIPVTLVDTAGARDTEDVVEREGVRRGAQAGAIANLVLVVVDRSEPSTEDDARLLAQTFAAPRLIVVNKLDRPAVWTRDLIARQAGIGDPEVIELSATSGAGLEMLRESIVRVLTNEEPSRDTAGISNARHLALMADACASLENARDAANARAPEELVLIDLQSARATLDEVVGVRTSADVLQHIFERFCIGK